MRSSADTKSRLRRPGGTSKYATYFFLFLVAATSVLLPILLLTNSRAELSSVTKAKNSKAQEYAGLQSTDQSKAVLFSPDQNAAGKLGCIFQRCQDTLKPAPCEVLQNTSTENYPTPHPPKSKYAYVTMLGSENYLPGCQVRF